MNTPPIQPDTTPPSMAPRPRMEPGAIIGLVVICAIVMLFIVSIMHSVLHTCVSRSKARQAHCLSNQRILADAIVMYAQDHEGRYPKTATVWTDLTTYIGYVGGGNKVLICPEEMNLPLGYGYSNALSGVHKKTITSPTTTLLTADSLHPIIVSESDIAKQRHEGGYVAAYCDGHAKFHPRPNKP